MTAKCFVDTNILFYAIDQDGSIRHQSARELLDRLSVHQFYLSTQVLLELANIASTKLGFHSDELIKVLDFGSNATVLDTTAADVIAAVRLTQSTSISIWDAMIVVAAAKAGCGTLYTEDLNHGQVIAGVQVFNPFREVKSA